MRFVVPFLALLVLFPVSSHAQFDASGRKLEVAPEPEPMTLEQVLPNINKASVINGGEYATVRTILERRVHDSQAKHIGEVRDVYVAPGGAVSSLVAVFPRAHLNGAVALEPQSEGVTGSEQGYQIGLSAADLKSIFPELVKRTKASDPAQKGISARKLVGADVYGSGGEEVGKLKEVLFDAKGERANLAFLIINYGPFKNKPVVVPFGIVDLQTKRDRPVLVISNSDLETVFTFLTNKSK